MIFKLAKNDFKTKYAGSYMGVLWAFVQPIITVLLYFFVFQIVFNRNSQNDTVPYVVWLTAGLVPWFYFQDVLSNGAQTLLAYNYLVKKVVFNIDVLPLVRTISALFVHGFFVLLLLIMSLIGGAGIHFSWIQVIYYSGCMFVFSLALTYLNSAITVFFKDLVQLINIFMQVFMWATPIMWDMSYLDSHKVIRFILSLNPMYYVVNGYREALFDQKWFWSHPWMTLYFWVVTLLLMLLGRTVFKRLKPHFADIL